MVHRGNDWARLLDRLATKLEAGTRADTDEVMEPGELYDADPIRRSSRNSEAGVTPVTSR